MKFPAYKSYKPTEVAWLGDIPEHWETQRLKFVGKSIIGLTFSPNDVTNEENGTLVLRSSNIQAGQLVDRDNTYVSCPILANLTTKAGDIIICSRNGSRDLIGKNAKVSSLFEGVSFGAFTTVFRSHANDFMYYVFNSQLFEYQSGMYLTSTINQLTIGALNSFEVPLPPHNEQQKVVEFLEHKTSQIDALIEKKRALIEKLNEKRAAVITQAVTKGLDPSVPMKDSGVEWPGTFPEHWNSFSVKFGLDMPITDGPHETPTILDDGIAFLSAEAVNEGKLDFDKKRGYISQEDHKQYSKR